MPRPSGIRIRVATLADLPLLVRHRRAMWESMGGYSTASLDSTDPLYSRWARRHMRAQRLTFWIAETRRGVAVGSGGLWIMDAQPRPNEPNGRRPYLLSMFTEPEFRGRGVASRIVKVAVADAKGSGYTQVILHAGRMGRRMYASLGFERSWEMRRRFGAPGAPPRRGPRNVRR